MAAVLTKKLVQACQLQTGHFGLRQAEVGTAPPCPTTHDSQPTTHNPYVKVSVLLRSIWKSFSVKAHELQFPIDLQESKGRSPMFLPMIL
jgi:hypothetical protein